MNFDLNNSFIFNLINNENIKRGLIINKYKIYFSKLLISFLDIRKTIYNTFDINIDITIINTIKHRYKTEYTYHHIIKNKFKHCDDEIIENYFKYMKDIITNGLYYLINKQTFKIIILTVYEYLSIINYINHDHDNLYNNIIIYDMYGNIVYNIDTDIDILDDYIKLLFFKCDLNFINLLDSIKTLFEDSNITPKLIMLEIILMKNYYFNIDRKLILEQPIKIFIDNVLNLTIQNDVLMKKMIDIYKDKTIHKFTDDYYKKYLKYKQKYVNLLTRNYALL